MERPKVVCLCGSTKFKEEFEEANKRLTLAGCIVLSVGFFGHADGYMPVSSVKKELDELHFRKIDMADEIFVLNVGDYIGESTANEVCYAWGQGKPICYLETNHPDREYNHPILPAEKELYYIPVRVTVTMKVVGEKTEVYGTFQTFGIFTAKEPAQRLLEKDSQLQKQNFASGITHAYDIVTVEGLNTPGKF